jgi:hypothetical protein
MFNNMYGFGQMMKDSFGSGNSGVDPNQGVNSFQAGAGESQIMDALMYQALQNQPVNPMKGTMFGMPGSTAVEVDEMTAASPAAAPNMAQPGGDSVAGNIASLIRMFM